MEFPDVDWRIVAPEETGWPSGLLAEARIAAVEFGSIAAVVVHRGRLVGFGGDLAQKVAVRSIRKSLLSALIGIEISRGRITLDATLAELGIDDLSPLTAEERQATVAHLLTARSGVYLPALAEDAALRAGKPARGSCPPGVTWCYNNWDFNALGTIYERATGRSLFRGLYEDIARPIGMADFRPEDGSYLRGPESDHPAYHMRLSARDLARFGLLYLNEGRWKEEQVVPSWWVRESTRAHAITPTGDGYGYMWWTTGHNGEAGNRSTAYRNRDLPKFRYFAQGADGQMIGVMPSLDLVIVNLATSRERSPDINARLGDFVRLVAEAAPH